VTLPPQHEKSPTRDTTTLAVVYTLLFHLVLWWGLPREFVLAPTAVMAKPESVRILLDETVMVEPEEPQEFVRAALDVAEAVPVETNNVSDRNQVAAQEEAVAPDPDNTPMVEGDMEESNRIVQGDPFDQTPPAPDSPPTVTPPDMLVAPALAEDGPAVLDLRGDATAMPEEIEVAVIPNEQTERSPLDGQGDAQAVMPAQAADNPQTTPRPRPRLPQRDNSFGPIKDNRLGAQRIGRTAIDAEYSEFGDYTRRLLEVIERRWRNLVQNSRALQFNGERITVEFAVGREGEIVSLEVLVEDAGELAKTLAVDAITAPAPYDEWTPEMILQGDDDDLGFRITFFY